MRLGKEVLYAQAAEAHEQRDGEKDPPGALYRAGVTKGPPAVSCRQEDTGRGDGSPRRVDRKEFNYINRTRPGRNRYPFSDWVIESYRR